MKKIPAKMKYLSLNFIPCTIVKITAGIDRYDKIPNDISTHIPNMKTMYPIAYPRNAITHKIPEAINICP